MFPDPSTAPPTSAITDQVRTRSFFMILAVSAIAVIWLFTPYLYCILFAATSAVVLQPLHQRVLRTLPNHNLAAAVSTTLFVLACLLPLALITTVSIKEASLMYRDFEQWRLAGGLEALLMDLPVESVNDVLPEWLAVDVDMDDALGNSVNQALPTAAPLVRSVLQWVLNAGVDLAIYLMLTFALLAEGPRVLRVGLNLIPMEERYSLRLYHVFEELSNNLVIGSLCTAILQGGIGAFGFWLFGVPHVALLGVGIALSSFVPTLGTVLIWLPVTAVFAMTTSWKLGLGLGLYHLVITGSVDNLVRPLLMRGRMEIHPILIFLSIFGGLAWMGVAGLLVGPMIITFFLSLYTMYCEDHLGLPRMVVEEPNTAPVRILKRIRDTLHPDDSYRPESV